MRTVGVVAVGAVAVALVAAPAAAPAQRAAPLVVGATPHSDPSDRAIGGYLRVTFSPDGNGRNDRVRVNVTARAGDQLVLRVHPESSARGWDAQVASAASGTTKLTWDGLLGSGLPQPDGSYILRVCDLTNGRCAATQVMAHLRVLSAYVPTTTAVSPGQTIPVVVQTDRPGPFTVDLHPASQPSAPGIGAAAFPAAGTESYVVPHVDGGLWILRVMSGSVFTQYPLIVRSTVPVGSPARGTALVVYPTMTWRAYDDADANRDGQVDSWYAHPRDPVVPLVGPYETFRQEAARAGREADPQDQQAFARWRKDHPAPAQFVTDIDLGRISLDTLRRYALIVFPGHTEYYEQQTYDNLIAYRNAGGHLYFMSGNSFYGQAKVGATTITRLSYRYRTATQSDFSLASVGFVTCCWPRTIKPRYHVTAAALAALPWLFDGTGLKAGGEFGIAEGEVDTIDAKLTPPGTIVVASAVVPAFKSVNPVEPQGWLGTVPFSYARPSEHPVTLDVAYAATARGAVFSWGNEGFMPSIYDPAVPQPERAALDRAAWNVWAWFAR
jgi:hypothetical protein